MSTGSAPSRMLADLGVQLHVAETKQGADTYNELAGTHMVGCLIHSTCRARATRRRSTGIPANPTVVSPSVREAPNDVANAQVAVLSNRVDSSTRSAERRSRTVWPTRKYRLEVNTCDCGVRVILVKCSCRGHSSSRTGTQ
jgi:hypothetical protein